MLRELLDRILTIQKDASGEFKPSPDSPLTYTPRNLSLIRDPLPDAVKMHTLSGLVDFLGTLKGDDYILHVEDYEEVSLLSVSLDDTKQRTRYAYAKRLQDSNPFEFGRWYKPDDFAIRLLSKFKSYDGDDLQELIRLSSNIRQEAVQVSEDDGISQKVAINQGISMKQGAMLKNRVMLAPFRTFPEVEQPLSLFLFRARGGSVDAMPELALFEADGGEWKRKATESIARHLRTLVANKKVKIVS